MTKGFLLGGLVGFLASFISKVKQLLTTFRSLLIQRDIIEFNSKTYLAHLIKHNRIILLNKFIDRYFFLYRRMWSKRTHMVTPVIHNYSGFAYINIKESNSFLEKMSNIFYLVADQDSEAFVVYYLRSCRIADKLYDLLRIEDFRSTKKIKEFYPYNFRIKHVKDNLDVTIRNPKRDTIDIEDSQAPSKLRVPSYLYKDPQENHYNVKVYKANYDVYSSSSRIRTPFDYIRRWYPLFYFSKEFKTLLKYGLIWTFCNEGDYNRKVGVVLYGPPGTGKSIMVTMLGLVLNRCIYVIDLLNTNQSTIVEKLSQLSRLDDIVLFEDIDVYFEFWEKNHSSNSLYSKDIIRPSTFLNLIDGVDKQAKCMFIFTTNYPEKIDKRLIDVNENGDVVITRPGRIDKAIKVGYAEIEGIEYICRRFAEQYNKALTYRRLNIRIDPEELINSVKQKYKLANGKLTYANIVNYCYEHLMKVLEVNYDELFKIVCDPEYAANVQY